MKAAVEALAKSVIVIIHGPQASGKTTHARQLMRHYGCVRVIDDWDGKRKLRPKTLALTTESPPFATKGAIVISIERALREL